MALLTKEVIVKWNGANRKHYESLGYKWSKQGDSFKIPVQDLPSGSKIMVTTSCDYCGEQHNLTWQHFLSGRKSSDKDVCSSSTCRGKKRTENTKGSFRVLGDYPNLLKEVYSKNSTKAKEELTGSHKKIKWQCSRCSFIWEATIANRVNGSGCPSCNRLKNSVPITKSHKKLVEEWYDSRNPLYFTKNSSIRVQWKCKKCSHIWKTSVSNRAINNTGCPKCRGMFQTKLYESHPMLLREWNDEASPREFTAGSGKKILWKCIDCDYEWHAEIRSRAHGSGCPRCARKYKDTLDKTHKSLVLEWKDKKFKPASFTAGSHKKIKWQCSQCGCTWRATIKNRVNGSGCPSCQESRGERFVSAVLQELGLVFEKEFTFEGLIGVGGRLLRYDFALKNKESISALIEYDGIQHFEAKDFFGGKEQFKIRQEHDELKNKYAKNNNIPLLRISYDTTQKEAREQLESFLKKNNLI